MLLSKLKIVIVVLLAVGILGTGAGMLLHQAAAQKSTGKPVKEESARGKTEVVGQVMSVDLAQNTITLLNKAFGQKTYEVAKNARIVLGDGTGRKTGFSDGKLSDVTNSVSVTLRLTSDQKAVVIYAEGPQVQGVLKALDAKANTVTVTTYPVKGEEAVDKTFTLADDAGVSVDHGKALKEKIKTDTLTDVPVGAVVTLQLSGDQKLVGYITAQGRTVHGSVRSVDAEKNTITLENKQGDQTFTVAKGASIWLDDGKADKLAIKQAKLGDLKAGASVTLRLSLDQKEVVSIRAEGGTFKGVLKSVDGAQNKITLTIGQKGEEPQDRTFDVAKDVRIIVDETTEGKLTDLPTDCQVSVKLSANQGEVIAIHADGPSVYGVVKGTVGDGQITLSNKLGDETYSVAKDAQVLVDDTRAGKLADLIDGTVVSAKLSVDKRRLVGTIRGEGPSFHGVVKAVDANTITLTIGGKNGVGGEDRTFNLTKDTAIVTGINGVPLKVSDVRADKVVHLQLSINQKAVALMKVVDE